MTRRPVGAVFTILMITCAAALPPGAATASAGGAPALTGPAVSPAAGSRAARSPFCRYLGVRYQASSAARLACFGPRRTGPATVRPVPAAGPGLDRPANVDAASPAEDVTSSGVRAYGQSEVSVAASGRYVVEAWNDATGLLSPCPSPMNKEERIGFGFSANGGRSFTDLGGLPNAHCRTDIYLGDPSVAAYRTGGRAYFYISGIYATRSFSGAGHVAMAACAVVGRGGAAALRCGQPVIVAISPECRTTGQSLTCDFLDKDYLAVDQARGRLYASYSVFQAFHPQVQIALAVCDLSTPAAPVCETGAKGTSAPSYFTVAHGDRAGCENVGAYPAVDTATGAVYVGYEFNWFTNGQPGPCNALPTADILTRTPLRCLPLAPVSPCRGPAARAAVPVTSMDQVSPAGNGMLNDFPRVAVSVPAGTVSMVWNDARFHPLGDILLRSFGLGPLAPVQRRPVVLNAPTGGFHFYPAVRTATATGRLDVSWYATRAPGSVDFGVAAALGVRPRQAGPPASSTRVTTVNWNAANEVSMLGPFGDYTDNALVTTGAPPYVGRTLFVAWSDGRLGVAQPFVARLPG